MGNSASKGARTLLRDIGKASRPLERSQPHALPLKALKDRFQGTVPDTPQSTTTSTPEGKDGMDPHVAGTSTYDPSFLQSVGDLGKQIKVNAANQPNPNSIALRQLSCRKQLFAEGEKEEIDASSGGQHGSRQTVSPLVMTNILREIHDSRVTTKMVADSYNVSETFVGQLGTRFKVATTMLILDEKTQEGELGHKTTSPEVPRSAKYDDMDSAGSDHEAHLEKLKKRISLDD